MKNITVLFSTVSDILQWPSTGVMVSYLSLHKKKIQLLAVRVVFGLFSGTASPGIFTVAYLRLLIV